MSKTLIAVGGTGQEIALACLRLAHMSGLEPPFVVVLDSDQGRTVGSTVRTRTEELQNIEGFLKAAYGIPSLLTLIKPIAENAHRNLSNLASLFAAAGAIPPKVQEVLSLLFTVQQQQTRLLDGFHGQPTVGAVAVHDYMLHPESSTDEGVISLLDERTQARTNHFIVLAGSTTGGTGPGTIPPISRKILQWRDSLQPKRLIHISGLLQLQWFHPIQDEGVVWSRPPDIDLVRLQRNSTCLVRQYHAELDRFLDRLVLIGLPEVIGRVSAGPNQQPETFHWLNVLSGWIANELLYAGHTLNSLPKGSLYGYALDAEPSPLEALRFERGERTPVSLGHALDATRIMAAFGQALRSQLGASRPDIAMPKETYRLVNKLYHHENGRERLCSN